VTRYRVAWEAGPGAQLELFSPETGTDVFRMRFSPPMRKTLRPPVSELRLGPVELKPINKRIGELVNAANSRGQGAAPGAAPVNVIKAAGNAGRLMQRHMVPVSVQSELAGGELFIELGLDEPLLEYPWELMHDGKDFLGCKHSVGRFVNVSKPQIPPQVRPEPILEDQLRVLIVSVPNPEPRDPGTRFTSLRGAERETEAMVRLLAAANADVTLISGRDATWDNVINALHDTTKRFHIVHYNGHATFNAQNPRQSALELYDQELWTAYIVSAFEARPPVLFFVNGCETARTQPGPAAHGGKLWQDTFEIFGLASAFLDTGAYLIGSRWEVGDDAAELFATTFYRGLLEEKPLGTLVRDARRACLQAAQLANSNDFSWASYAFYGDPRLYFSKVADDPAAAPASPPAAAGA
jgi:hypothetical protein